MRRMNRFRSTPPPVKAHAERLSRRGDEAFTLLEVLIAIALLVMLGGTMFGFLSNLAQKRADLADLGRQAQATEALMSALEHDLMTALAGDALAGSGIVGGRDQLRILSRGVLFDLSNPSLGDLQQTIYRFRSAERAVECSRRDLYATAGSAAESGRTGPRQAPDPRSVAGGFDAERILVGVRRMEFRYYADGAWQRSFDSRSAGRLPAAVEIAIWYERPGQEDDLDLHDSAEAESEIDEADLERRRDLFGEEHERAQLSFDLADLRERQDPADRRRVIVIPQVGLVSTARSGEESDFMDQQGGGR